MVPTQRKALRRDAVENRERLLDAATDAVRRDGERVPIATIAALAGTGVGTVYRHFPTRQDLLAALVRRSFELVLANARDAAASADDPVECLAAFFRAAVRDRERFVLPLHGGPAVFDDETPALRAEVRRVIGSILERGRAAGTVRNDLSPNDVVLAGAMLAQPLPAIDDWDAVAHRQIDLLLAGLVTRDPPGTYLATSPATGSSRGRRNT